MLFTKTFLCTVNAQRLACDVEHVTRIFSLTNIIMKHQYTNFSFYIWFGYLNQL